MGTLQSKYITYWQFILYILHTFLPNETTCFAYILISPFAWVPLTLNPQPQFAAVPHSQSQFSQQKKKQTYEPHKLNNFSFFVHFSLQRFFFCILKYALLSYVWCIPHKYHKTYIHMYNNMFEESVCEYNGCYKPWYLLNEFCLRWSWLMLMVMLWCCICRCIYNMNLMWNRMKNQRMFKKNEL